ncbi:MAG: tripartite tricarboxylate transporter TctB family protein [Bacteroidota bacterium]
MKKWERIAAVVLILAGIGAAFGALEIGFGSFMSPGPGFLPFWLSIVLAIISTVYLIINLGSDAKVKLWPGKTWFRPLVAIVVMFTYGYLMKWFGFCTATLVLFVTWMTVVAKEKWSTVALVSILTTGIAYLLFEVFLKVPLPKGILF